MKQVDDILAQVKDLELRDQLESLGRAMENDPRSQGEPATHDLATPKHKLPAWAEDKRGVPNSLLRGALFAAIQGKDRRYLNREVLATQSGILVRFTGGQLDQSDLDVWQHVLQLAHAHPLGAYCEFSATAFLKGIGRATGKTDHEWLKHVFARLVGCALEVTHNKFTYLGNLMELTRDEDTGQYALSLNPKLIDLFQAGWTATDWEQRQILRRKPLALWLHGFYSSHAEPYSLTVEYLHQISGSTTRAMRNFRIHLIRAHEDLKVVGAINDFDVQGNLVTVDSMASHTQRKHLKKVGSRKK